MRPTVLLLLICTTISLGAKAQVTLIPRTGVSSNNYAFNEPSSVCSHNRVGVTAGLGVNVPIGKGGVLSLQTECNLIQKNMALAVAWDFDLVKVKRVLTYVEMPVLARIQLRNKTENRRTSTYLYIGPGIGYALGGHHRWHHPDHGREVKNKIKFAPDPDPTSPSSIYYADPKIVNRWDITLQAGMGTGIPIGPGTLLVETRFGYGLSNFFKDRIEYEPGGYEHRSKRDQRSRTFTLSVGYALPLKKRK